MGCKWDQFVKCLLLHVELLPVKKEETNSLRPAQTRFCYFYLLPSTGKCRHVSATSIYFYLQENGCTGVGVDAGSIDRSFAAASMPGTLCATRVQGCRRCSQAQTLNVATRRRREAIHIVPFPSGKKKRIVYGQHRRVSATSIYFHLQENADTFLLLLSTGKWLHGKKKRIVYGQHRRVSATSIYFHLQENADTFLLLLSTGKWLHGKKKRIVYGLLREICFTLIYRKMVPRVAEDVPRRKR
ncbi:hypothetical protein M513_11973 [Trichuris suis]|uniref:Uncharacterized protein n=1 Tax=Trichuris suis TaxID=68888 RepID=A0A085LQB8_9BILA|nr:hypothetical protein M513_11973 [Trichuris suis]